jgi:hypothetical protein
LAKNRSIKMRLHLSLPLSFEARANVGQASTLFHQIWHIVKKNVV